MEQQRAVSGVRYRLIDSLRGLALLNMVAFHFCYDVFVIYEGQYGWPRLPGIVAWERFICMTFILVSGISLNFSRHPYRRALIINGCGLLITLVTAIAIPEEAIWFGVLNGIGCSMLITQALRRWLEKCDPFVGAAVSFLLLAVFYGLPSRTLGFFNIEWVRLPDALYAFRPLAIIGLPDAGFASSDYFPVLPWLFLFVCGFFLWRVIVSLRADRFFVRGVPVLDFLGRYSLWIYMIHQPLLMGVCFLIYGRF